jgi:hypothetical protein
MKNGLIVLSAVWVAAAFWHAGGQAPRIMLPALWGLFVVALLIWLWVYSGGLLPLIIYVLAVIAATTWWLMLSPSNERDWSDDVAQMTHGEIDGNVVTLHNVRNFDWRTSSDYTANWETRSYNLDQLNSTDLILSYWTGPAIAHVLVSFGFADGRYLAFSVEVRKHRHEKFSEFGGFFKRFELSVVAADERDIVRLRTNVRDDPPEQVYLYRMALAPDARRSLFLAFINEANSLQQQPRFYHTITTNCTTMVWRMMKHVVPDLPLDYRLLLPGYLPEYAYDVGGLDDRYTLAELKAMANITARARATDEHDDFSAAIRVGIPELANKEL